MSRWVEVRDGSALLPHGLWEALGQPRRLVALRHRRTAQFALWSSESFRKHRFRSWLRAACGLTLAKGRPRVDGDRVEVRELPLPDGLYGVIHRRTHFLLSPVDEASGESDGDFWRGQQNYQEHRPVGEQKEDHQSMTDRLLETLVPLGGASYLEIGCGAGRNLLGLKNALPHAEIGGLDIHAAAVDNARAVLPGARLEVGDLHDLAHWESRSWDIVFTSGTLMHVEHDRIAAVVRELNRIARRAVVHYEYHGPSYPFDFRYYPRDYAQLYQSLALPEAQITYEVLDRSGYRKRLSGPFDHCVLTAAKRSD